MTISTERQNQVRALAEPMIEEAISRMVNAGIAPHEIAQIMILQGAGLLTAALGPKHAGYDLRTVAQHTSAWIEGIADHCDAVDLH